MAIVKVLEDLSTYPHLQILKKEEKFDDYFEKQQVNCRSSELRWHKLSLVYNSSGAERCQSLMESFIESLEDRIYMFPVHSLPRFRLSQEEHVMLLNVLFINIAGKIKS